MHSVLAKIIENKKAETARRKKEFSLEQMIARSKAAGPRRSLVSALSNKQRACIIAEIKRASPSAGLIRPDFDPVAIAMQYTAAGADAVSVLTEELYFKGSLDFLGIVRAATPLPVLRKDFIIDRYHVYEAAAAGADAILLIAHILEAGVLKELSACAAEAGLDVLFEVHREEELDAVLACAPRIVGINNRDLEDLSVDTGTAARIAPKLPAGIIAVAESGITARHDIERYEGAGIHAFLIGETLMRSGDIKATMAQLRGLS